MRCSECSHRQFKAFDEKVIESHLKGIITAGVYPMLPDETCRFLVFDFDGKDCSPSDLKRDTADIREVCNEFDIDRLIPTQDSLPKGGFGKEI